MSGKPRIGFIGIGMMGKPMSKRVLQAGYPLTVYDIRPEPVAELVAAGAKKATNAKEIAEVSDIVLTSLPTIEAWQEVYFGSNGLLAGARAGEILVETSTVAPSDVKKAAEAAREKGVTVIDAPLISGGRVGIKGASDEVAAQGRIMVVVGGEPQDVAKVRPVLETFGNPVVHTGPLGSGELTKVLVNGLAHANWSLACEVLAVGAKAGMDMKSFYDVLSQTGGRSFVLEDYVLQFMKTGSGRVMRTVVAVKDSESMMEIARELGVPVLMLAINHGYYEWAQNSGLRDRPWIEMLKLWEGVIGKPIRFPER